jgi:single-strand DNA-binding protein
MRQQTITVAGNLTADPELHFTPSGKAVANFSVVVNNRRVDKRTNEWTDGTPTFWRCQLWGQPAENLTESLTRGMRVLLTGRVETREWNDRQTDEKRTALELIVEKIGASLQFATVSVSKVDRNDSAQRSAPPAGAQVTDDEPPL